MAQNSPIEWTDHTFNPWWGCTKISQGCKHCYAETWSSRYGFEDVWGPNKVRRTFGEKHWKEPLKWNRLATESGTRVRVFCASMADVFENNPSVESERIKLWRLIEQTPMLDWLLLTKRPENMLKFAPWTGAWPQNVWAMTSVENQKEADRRIPELLQVPASVHALSAEPLLGRLNLRPWLDRIDWVIVGGESGSKARQMRSSWARDLRDQCEEATVAFFFKQWGEWAPTADSKTTMAKVGKKTAGRLLDGTLWNQLPIPRLQQVVQNLPADQHPETNSFVPLSTIIELLTFRSHPAEVCA